MTGFKIMNVQRKYICADTERYLRHIRRKLQGYNSIYNTLSFAQNKLMHMFLTVLEVCKASGPSECLLKGDPNTERTKVGVFTPHLQFCSV